MNNNLCKIGVGPRSVVSKKVVDILTHAALAIIMSYVLAHVIVWIWIGCPIDGL